MLFSPAPRTGTTALAFSPSGMLLAVGWHEGLLRVYATPSLEVLYSLQHNSTVVAFGWEASEERLLWIDERGQLCVWRLTEHTAELITTITHPDTFVLCADFVEDARRVLVVRCSHFKGALDIPYRTHHVTVLDVDSTQVRSAGALPSSVGHEDLHMGPVRFAPDGASLLGVSVECFWDSDGDWSGWKRRVHCWDAFTLEERAAVLVMEEWSSPEPPECSFALDAEGNVAVNTRRGTVEFVSATQFLSPSEQELPDERHTWELSLPDVYDYSADDLVAFSRDGKRLAVCSAKGKVVIGPAEEWHWNSEHDHHAKELQCTPAVMVFSPEDFLTIGTTSGEVLLLDHELHPGRTRKIAR